MTDALITTLGSAFLIGFLGSTHCLGMCGGIASSLSLALPVGPGYRRRQVSLLAGYNLGRILSYSLIGLIAGLPGALLTQGVPGAGMVLRTLAGVVLILLGLAVGQWWQGIMSLERIGAPLWQRLAPLTQRFMPVDRLSRALPLGLLWGWLPCGLVYSTLAWALTQGDAVLSGLLMFAFGLGTVPAMVATGLLANRITRLRQSTAFRRVTGLALVVFGLWTIPLIQHLILPH